MAEEEQTINEPKTVLTYEGVRKYEAELHDLKVNRRQEVAAKLKDARAQGDLSENGEYDAAKEEQAQIEGRIEELTKLLKNAEVIVAEDVDDNKVSVGSIVKVHDEEEDEDVEYAIVGSSEADVLQNKISNESPVGRSLIGAHKGETVTVDAPGGELKFKVLSIRRAED